MELMEKLISEGRRHGICTEGMKRIMSEDKDAMVDYYIRIIDWSLENGYPDLETLRSEFSGFEEKGIYVGKTFSGEVFDKLQTYVFHNCKGTIKVAMGYENAVIPMLYFANGCDIRVECEQKNIPAIKVPVYVFGNNDIRAVDGDNVKFKFYKKDLV